MKKYIVPLVLLLVMFTPGVSMAETEVSVVAKVEALQAQIQMLQIQITNLQANAGTSLSASSTGKGQMEMKAKIGIEMSEMQKQNNLDKRVCHVLVKNLRKGMSDKEEIMKLQAFLAAQPEASWPMDLKPTGYFGLQTEAAIQRLQKANGLVSSGDAVTTGYGQVGPSTRALIQRLSCKDVPMPKIGLEYDGPRATTTMPKPTTKPNLLVAEQVKCVFNGATTEQKCYSSNNVDWFSCVGVGVCVVDVKGASGSQLMWKSSCDGKNLPSTVIDGTSEHVNFYCSSATSSQVVSSIPWDMSVLALDGVDRVSKIDIPLQEAIKFISDNSRFKISYKVVESSASHTYTKYDCAEGKATCVIVNKEDISQEVMNSLPAASSHGIFWKTLSNPPLQAGSTWGVADGVLKDGMRRPYFTVATDPWWYNNQSFEGFSSRAAQIMAHELINVINSKLEVAPYYCKSLSSTAPSGAPANEYEKSRLEKLTAECYSKIK